MKFKCRLAAAIGCATLLFFGSASAAEPSTEPILRIETVRHTAPIRRIATDAGSRWLATVSDDKTLRLWDLQKASIMQTLRPPIDKGNAGKLYSVAMSPDGAYVATGGWTLWGKGTSIYVFRRDGGHLVHHIADLPNVIYELAWSPDGRYLAAGMGGRSGVRVFRSENYAMVGQDRDYGNLVKGLDFDKQGRLVTSSYDGLVRLYQVGPDGLKMLNKKAAPGGKMPVGVRFAPDGKRIAVGFYDAPAINLLSADSLDFIAAPEALDLRRDEGLPAVCWSADGGTLFAGGTARSADGKSRIIRAWSQGGLGEVRDLAAAYNTIEDIRSLAGGGVVFSAFDPAWGILDASGRRTAFVSAVIADFRDSRENFRLSRDGLSVRFSFAPLGTVFGRFDFAERRYGASTSDAGLFPPRVTAEGIDVRQWAASTRPTLNGQALQLSDNERSRSLAISPDGQSFVLGTEWFLRRFDLVGRELWRIEAPGTAWAVNISPDGRWVVAAYADGTIRWHRLSDGKQQVAFFPHIDQKRWVAWTPSGYYNASPGAEDMIGWHINYGKDKAADFFPVSRFRSQLYRPDVIDRIFDTLDEGEALRRANLEAGRTGDTEPIQLRSILPPVIEILSPKDGAAVSQADITLKVRLRTPADAPVTGFRARVNGQPVTLTGNADHVTISIPPQDSIIQIFAENRHGVSVPAVLMVTWKGAVPAVSQEAFEVKPKLYVLAVGVSRYDNPRYNLGLAAKDARDFAAALQDQKGKLYREVEIKLLTDKKANRDEVLEGLDWLQKQVTARDIGMLFLAGHGFNDATGVYYFMPSNADVDKLKSTGVVFTEIKNTLSNLAGKSIFFVDTCHSGNVLGSSRRAISADITGVINELASAENGVVVFSSSTGRQYSLENPEWGNGAFTKALVEGFKGKANYGKTGRITHKMLDFYISERVKEITEGQQTPVTQAPGGVPDFPIALASNQAM
jgi:WD40 repeat protein